MPFVRYEQCLVGQMLHAVSQTHRWPDQTGPEIWIICLCQDFKLYTTLLCLYTFRQQ